MTRERTPQAGDIFVLCDGSGRWSGAYGFVRFDDADPSHLIVRDRSTGELFDAPPGLLRRPAIGADAEEPAAPAGEEPGDVAGPDLITDAQRRLIFARAHELGMDLDAVRAATPHGSVSALTRAEARELIDRMMKQPANAWQDQGTATGKQLGTIEYLRGLVGFSDTEFKHWLGKRFKVESLAQITD